MSDTDTPSSGPESTDPVAMFESVLGKSFGEAPPALAAAAPDELEDDAEKRAAPADELVDEDPPAEKRMFKVRADGQDLEVDEAELVKGYSRQQNYTKQTMELAGQRQQYDQAQAQINAERQQYQAQLGQLTQALGEQLNNQPNWQELLDTDPVEYLRQQHLFTERQAAYQNAQQARQQYDQQTQQQAAQSEQQRQAHEREQLLANLPAWADDAKAAKEKALIVKSLTAMGRTPEQISKFDHIDVLVARKAALYDQMVAKAKDTTAKVAALPPRMQKPGASRPTDGRTVDMQALRKSGSTSDAAALFEKML